MKILKLKCFITSACKTGCCLKAFIMLPSRSSTAPSRSTHTIVRDKRCSSRRSWPPSTGFPSPSGQGEKTIGVTSISLPPLPTRRSCPGRIARCFRHHLNLKNTARALSLWFSMLGDRLYKLVNDGRFTSAIALSHRMRHSCRWSVGTDEGRGWGASGFVIQTTKVPETDV
jgi:hypothetical protein